MMIERKFQSRQKDLRLITEEEAARAFAIAQKNGLAYANFIVTGQRSAREILSLIGTPEREMLRQLWGCAIAGFARVDMLRSTLYEVQEMQKLFGQRIDPTQAVDSRILRALRPFDEDFIKKAVEELPLEYNFQFVGEATRTAIQYELKFVTELVSRSERVVLTGVS